MKTFARVVGIWCLLYGLWLLVHGEWLGFIQFSAMGWATLIDPRKRSTAKWRYRLMLVALACALLRLIL